MSIDRSLKVNNALNRHRNVLSRDERIERLMDEGSWEEENGVTGLPKVSNRKAVAGAKKKKE
jgi:small basic protein (TIGR04137 family)